MELIIPMRSPIEIILKGTYHILEKTETYQILKDTY